MQTDPAVEQNKNVEWSESPWHQSGIGKEKIYGGGGNDLPKSRVPVFGAPCSHLLVKTKLSR